MSTATSLVRTRKPPTDLRFDIVKIMQSNQNERKQNQKIKMAERGDRKQKKKK